MKIHRTGSLFAQLNGVELLVEGVPISGIISHEEAESIRAKFAEQGYRVEIRN